MVGRDRFAAACEWAWRTAAGTGRAGGPVSEEDAAEARAAIDAMSEAEWERLPTVAQALYLERSQGGGSADASETAEWPDDLEDVPHDLDDAIWWQGDAPPAERLEAALAVYRAMPCYTILNGLNHVFDDLPRDVRARLWAEYRALLEQPDDRLAGPVEYSLWVDFYEVAAKEAWRETALHEPLADRRTERVLDNSGPVPFKLKERLYERLIDDARWHGPILTSLLRSAADVYGDLHPRRARRWLARLDLPPDTPGLAALREALGAR